MEPGSDQVVIDLSIGVAFAAAWLALSPPPVGSNAQNAIGLKATFNAPSFTLCPLLAI